MPSTKVELRTKHGHASVMCDALPGDSKIVFATEAHTFRFLDEVTDMPAGVAYVRNNELAHRTHGRIRFQIVEGGLFSLVRMCGHVADGNATEAELLFRSRKEIRSCADFLVVSGVMRPDECAQVLDHLKTLEAEFAHPKRVEAKLTVATRLSDAHERKATARDGRKNAPAAMTTYAATSHVSHRIEEVFSINRYFTSRTLQVYTLIARAQAQVEELWKFLAPAADKKCPLKGPLACELLDPARDRDAISLLRRRIAGYAHAMKSLTYQPYRTVAELVVSQLGDMGRSLAASDRDLVGAYHLPLIRRTLRRLRIIYYLETEVIARLSVYLEQTPKEDRVANASEQSEFRLRFQAAHKKLLSFTHGELDKEILRDVFLRFGAALDVLQTDPDEVKRLLKEASAVLAFGPSNSLVRPFQRTSIPPPPNEVAQTG